MIDSNLVDVAPKRHENVLKPTIVFEFSQLIVLSKRTDPHTCTANRYSCLPLLVKTRARSRKLGKAYRQYVSREFTWVATSVEYMGQEPARTNESNMQSAA